MSAYYKIRFGTGFAWLQSYVVKVDRPTTDYGSLTNILIDYLVEHDKRNILDMQNEYEWADDNGEKIVSKDGSTEIYADEFVQGGNCGDVLMHYGSFDIDLIAETEDDKITLYADKISAEEFGKLTVIDWS